MGASLSDHHLMEDRRLLFGPPFFRQLLVSRYVMAHISYTCAAIPSIMIASVERSSLSGEVYAPPSKSYTHRAILITSLGPGGTVKRPLLSADTRATIAASEAFGARISLGDDVSITGVSDRPQTPEDVINVLNSGTTLRFCSAVAALTDGAVLTGDTSIRTRPNGPLLSTLSELGATGFFHSQ